MIGADQGQALGDIIRGLSKESGLSLSELNVLTGGDPYRLDTPANHRNGRWFRDQLKACDLGFERGATIHLRGAHYAIVSLGGAKLPNGKPYINDQKCWEFLQEHAAKAARWLGYVPFENIIDARNAEPVIYEAPKRSYPNFFPSTLSSYSFPDPMKPRIFATGFEVQQPYRLAIFGEKTSLEKVLLPIADSYGVDLYLPAGEMSDTLIHRMAKTGAEDGREMVVFVLADCDPSGYQMATSIAHKLRALVDSRLPSLRFQLHPTCLTVEQVKELGLPSSPLKPDELRAGGWRARYGIEQTEIDALATLQPRVLQEIVENAIAPFYDETLASRVRQEKARAEFEVNGRLEAWLNTSNEPALREKAAAAIEAAKAEVERYGDAVSDAAERICREMPAVEVPEAIIGETPEPLVSSDMELLDHIQALRARKDYSTAAEGALQ